MVSIESIFVFNATLFIEAFFLLFSILDPIGTVPIFMAITEDFPEKRKRIVRHSVILATIILYIFAYVGWFIFQVLGITIDDFRIAGGIVLFVVALDHLSGRDSRTRKLEAEDIAAFPLATPLLAGPGAISTVVILANPPYGPFLTFIVVGINSILAYIILLRSDVVQRVLGVNGSRAMTRIMALLIAAVGVAFVREGVVGIIKGMG